MAFISIHALREEGDQTSEPTADPDRDFYPRPPRGGRRASAQARAVGRIISIHALREEGDRIADCAPFAEFISIHALREEGDKYWVFEGRTNPKFLSTPSARRATQT